MGLDGVELVLAWEDTFGITFSDQEPYSMRTPEQVADVIFSKLRSGSVAGNGNLPQRAFHILRRAFHQAFGTPRAALSRDAKIIDLIPGRITTETWDRLRMACGVTTFPKRSFGTPKTVSDLIDFLVIHHTPFLKTYDEAWSHSQVLDVVRAVIRDQLGIKKFSNKDDFQHDLKVD